MKIDPDPGALHSLRDASHPLRRRYGTLEVAAARRDRRDLVLPSPCFKLILARPAELSVTTVRGREYEQES